MISDRSLDFFKKAAKEIPAYKQFLKAHGVNPNSIKTSEDYSTFVPITSKKTYLQTNKHADLVWPKDWNGPMAFCSTSGSTGEPYYFPRNDRLAWQASWMAEDFLRQTSYGQGRTLVLMGLGMGVWIGGLITLRAFEIAAERMKAPAAFLSPGYNKKEMFKALKKLSPEFDQTIIVGYPPFVKELIDESRNEGVNLKKLNVRLMFAAEAFTETFRKYVCKESGVKNPLLDTLNIYGTADIGAMAHETPLSILVRRLALEDPLLYQNMFGQIEKTPTLAQYNPRFIEFEESDGQLLLTGNGALPLLRYAVGDHGGIFTYAQARQLFRQYGVNLEDEIDKAGIRHTVRKRPFVFVYERTDLSTTLHGIIIYPEFVKEGLLTPLVSPYFTGRFTMSTKHDIRHNQFLQINVEMRGGMKPTEKFRAMALKSIRNSLVEKSSEYAEVAKTRPSIELIQIVLWEHEHPRYFAPGTKQKWVEKV